MTYRQITRTEPVVGVYREIPQTETVRTSSRRPTAEPTTKVKKPKKVKKEKIFTLDNLDKLEGLEMYDNDYDEWRPVKIVRAPFPAKVPVYRFDYTEVVKNIFYIAMKNKGGQYMQIIGRIGDLKIFEDFAHVNVDTGHDNRVRDKEGNIYPIRGYNFCNPIRAQHLWANPAFSAHQATLNLRTITDDDRYRSHLNTEITRIDSPIECRACGKVLKDFKKPIELLTGCCTSCLQSNLDRMKNLDTEKTYYKSRENRYYTTTKPTGPQTSKYYREIPAEVVKIALSEIPKTDISLVCLGCGSAGSNIVDQLSRTALIDDMMVVDPDTIEAKNLYNQVYTSGQIGGHKAEYLAKNITYNSNNKIKVTYKTRMFQDCNFGFIRSKFMILGFDTIKTRLDAFDQIITKKMEAKYLIDARYADLTSSLYFIDMSNEAEVNYYHKRLKADAKVFEEIESRITTNDYTIDIIRPFLVAMQNGRCAEFADKYLEMGRSNFCRGRNRCEGTYRSGGCGEKILNHIKENKITLPDGLLKKDKIGDTCVKANIIDVYKFTSSFVTAAIRDMKNGKEKPFTHLEISTDGLPKIAKMR